MWRRMVASGTLLQILRALFVHAHLPQSTFAGNAGLLNGGRRSAPVLCTEASPPPGMLTIESTETATAPWSDQHGPLCSHLLGAHLITYQARTLKCAYDLDRQALARVACSARTLWRTVVSCSGAVTARPWACRTCGQSSMNFMRCCYSIKNSLLSEEQTALAACTENRQFRKKEARKKRVSAACSSQ